MAGRKSPGTAVGVLATLVYAVVALSLNNGTALPAELVNALAFGASGVWSYIGHYHITFRSDAAHRSSILRFLVLAAIGYAVSSAIVKVNDRLGLPRNLATVMVTFVLPVLNFVLMQLWVFARRRAMPAPVPPLPKRGGAP